MFTGILGCVKINIKSINKMRDRRVYMDITLVIMAAGIGSRYGGGIKQLEKVGPNGEIIMDYSVKDAVEAGFNKVVFIIRKDLEKDFREIIGNRIEKECRVEYAFQELDDLPAGFTAGERKKPWGTGQAILACKGIVNEPFAIINADDYYGKEAFRKIYGFLSETEPKKYCGAAFILKNTLSDNGGVTRGICSLDADMKLIDIRETSNIVKTAGGGAEADGKSIDPNSYVSMNMWGVTPEYIDILERDFIKFLSELEPDDVKSEFLIPIHMDSLIKSGEVTVKMLETNDKWFGVTYKEDKAAVTEAFKRLHAAGEY